MGDRVLLKYYNFQKREGSVLDGQSQKGRRNAILKCKVSLTASYRRPPKYLTVRRIFKVFGLFRGSSGFCSGANRGCFDFDVEAVGDSGFETKLPTNPQNYLYVVTASVLEVSDTVWEQPGRPYADTFVRAVDRT